MIQFYLRSPIFKRFPFSSLISSPFYFQSTSSPKSPLQSLSPSQNLSSSDLVQCSDLMRRILSKEQVRQVKVLNQQKTTEESAEIQKRQEQEEESNHDLQHFKHMLAGPLVSEANLDKFCLQKRGPLLLDIKYDGERTMISYQRGQEMQMLSRNGKSQDSYYRSLHQAISDQLEASSINSIKLDGEIVLVEAGSEAPLPFNELQKQRRSKGEDREQGVPSGQSLLVYVFDVLEKDGKDMLRQPLLQRRKLIPQGGIFRKAEHKIVHFPQERAKIFQFFREVLGRHYQGLILKRCDDAYFTNESRSHWKKLKRGFASNRDARISKIELDLVVMGANRGQGSKNSRNFTSYLLGTPHQGKILPISNVGSGLTEQMMTIIAKHVEEQGLRVEQVPAQYSLGSVKADVYYKPFLVFEVHAQELTVSPLYKLGEGEFGGLSLRFPVFKAIRDDKGVDQATSGEQILELSKAYNFNLP